MDLPHPHPTKTGIQGDESPWREARRAEPFEVLPAVSTTNENAITFLPGDDNTFMQAYDDIFDCGIYNNLETGAIDPCGINYYGPDLIDPIIAKLLDIKPADHEKLVEWLNTAKKYNGFYILGV